MLARIRTITSGWQGGPGLTQMFFGSPTTGGFTQSDVDAAAAAVRSFFYNARSCFPTAWSAQVQGDVEILDPTTGALTGLMQVTTTPAPVGGLSGNWGPTACGAAVTWRSSSVIGRRLARGRTFMTPLQAGCYDTTGVLTSTATSALQTAGAGLIADTASQLVIWHRPTKKAPSGGQYTATMSASCTGMPVVLRSRRD